MLQVTGLCPVNLTVRYSMRALCAHVCNLSATAPESIYLKSIAKYNENLIFVLNQNNKGFNVIAYHKPGRPIGNHSIDCVSS